MTHTYTHTRTHHEPLLCPPHLPSIHIPLPLTDAAREQRKRSDALRYINGLKAAATDAPARQTGTPITRKQDPFNLSLGRPTTFDAR